MSTPMERQILEMAQFHGGFIFPYMDRHIQGFSLPEGEGGADLMAGENVLLWKNLRPGALEIMKGMHARDLIAFEKCDAIFYLLDPAGCPRDLPIWEKKMGIRPARLCWLPVRIWAGRGNFDR